VAEKTAQQPPGRKPDGRTTNMSDFKIFGGVLLGYGGTDKTVQIPETVHTIAGNAFANCDCVEKIIIPQSVYTIQYYAFYRCNNLVEIILSEGIMDIRQKAVAYCKNLKTVKIFCSPDEIGSPVFYGCDRIEEVFLSSSLRWKAESLFPKQQEIGIIYPLCDDLSYFPTHKKAALRGFMELCENKDFHNDELWDANIAHLRRIRKVLFRLMRDDVKLCSFLADNNILTLDMVDALLEEEALGVEIKATLLSIRESHFTEAQKNEKYEKTAGIRELKTADYRKIWSFYKNYKNEVVITGYKGKDTQIIIPDHIGRNPVTEIGPGAFSPQKSGISNERREVLNRISSVTIPDTVREIGKEAFGGCRSLIDLYIGNPDAEIGERAFIWCHGLTDSDGFIIVNNIIFGYSGQNSHITIPDGIKRIDCLVFSDDRNLISISLPDSVQKICKSAFSDCVNLVSLEISESTQLEDRVFVGCKGLAGEQGFVAVNGVLFDYFGEENDVLIPEGITKISGHAFAQKKITSVVIPSGVKSIGNAAFLGCRNMKTLIFNNRPEYIPENMCYCCESLQNLIIPDSVKIIGECAFEFCTELDTVVVPDSVTTIRDYAFSGCRNLTTLTLGRSVKSICRNAFYHCAGLRGVVIPAAVEEILNGAFDFCPELKTVIFEGATKWISESAFGRISEQAEIRAPFLPLDAFRNQTVAAVRGFVHLLSENAVSDNKLIKQNLIYVKEKASILLELFEREPEILSELNKRMFGRAGQFHKGAVCVPLSDSEASRLCDSALRKYKNPLTAVMKMSELEILAAELMPYFEKHPDILRRVKSRLIGDDLQDPDDIPF